MSPFLKANLERFLFWVKHPLTNYSILITLIHNIFKCRVCPVESGCSRPSFERWSLSLNSKADCSVQTELTIGLSCCYVVSAFNKFSIVNDPSISLFPLQNFQLIKVPENYFSTGCTTNHNFFLFVYCHRKYFKLVLF